MTTMIFGGGHLGQALAAALRERGEPAPVILGRPAGGRHPAMRMAGADLVFEASIPGAVSSNVAVALACGCRRFVIATTGWDDARDAIDGALRAHDAAAVAAPNFSLGVAAMLRLVEVAGSLFAHLDDFDPFVFEWHRRGKVDRPSGTARELARRLLAADTRRNDIAFGNDGPPAPGQLEVASLRAGASPGMHVVGFDASGETLELRLTARDRSAYAAGALTAAGWLRAETRAPGIHGFDEVIDELFASAATPATAPTRKLRAVAGLAG